MAAIQASEYMHIPDHKTEIQKNCRHNQGKCISKQSVLTVANTRTTTMYTYMYTSHHQ